MVFLELQEDDVRSSGSSSPESTGSVETSISSRFGGNNYPSLFSSRPTTYGGASQPSERSGGSRVNNPSMYMRVTVLLFEKNLRHIHHLNAMIHLKTP
ncbi:hypothetical protein V6N11_031063 [Hibiscus sabdariffa]|uniref:Uncharacterized protein n=1 Tax=Hibiscus sabdariffa TaxID=183260 RepID=A0ABR1ZWC6_9ROSI